ncbi:MAG: tRNA (adenosine(37)-N6)-threonylcarbamoyltransferase complex ATPase subunit type 1 TsaE [Clostridiales bacterium]|nr:tRNA (adenosine(37)-N6)-threonylcarbamoyltransferase complex ATPase subunit type 1 TsaE [Clostridiales bacterium]
MKENVFIMKNERDTEKFGIKLGQEVKTGTVIALSGELGTGKTTLTKAIAKGLSIEETITSPTFNIVKEYDGGRLPLYHFDVYRIGDVEEMYELGYEEYFYGEGVCVIEWASIIEEIIPDNGMRIDIQYGREEGERVYKCIF